MVFIWLVGLFAWYLGTFYLLDKVLRSRRIRTTNEILIFAIVVAVVGMLLHLSGLLTITVVLAYILSHIALNTIYRRQDALTKNGKATR